jgi:hypothetical protein
VSVRQTMRHSDDALLGESLAVLNSLTCDAFYDDDVIAVFLEGAARALFAETFYSFGWGTSASSC